MGVEATSCEPKASERIVGSSSLRVDGSIGHAEMYFGNRVSGRRGSVCSAHVPVVSAERLETKVFLGDTPISAQFNNQQLRGL